MVDSPPQDEVVEDWAGVSGWEAAVGEGDVSTDYDVERS